MVFFHGKIYVVDANTEDFLAMDIADDHDNGKPRVSRIECIIKGVPLSPRPYVHHMHYLLECHGTLLMTRRNVAYTQEFVATRISPVHVASDNEFEVLSADFRCSVWVEMRNLGADLALFLGQGCSRVVCVSPYDLARDCIFFLDDYTGWHWKKTTMSCRVYDMKDGKVYPTLPTISWTSDQVPGTWLFSQGMPA